MTDSLRALVGSAIYSSLTSGVHACMLVSQKATGCIFDSVWSKRLWSLGRRRSSQRPRVSHIRHIESDSRKQSQESYLDFMAKSMKRCRLESVQPEQLPVSKTHREASIIRKMGIGDAYARYQYRLRARLLVTRSKTGLCLFQLPMKTRLLFPCAVSPRTAGKAPRSDITIYGKW